MKRIEASGEQSGVDCGIGRLHPDAIVSGDIW
jgi:hypothetical protein